MGYFAGTNANEYFTPNFMSPSVVPLLYFDPYPYLRGDRLPGAGSDWIYAGGGDDGIDAGRGNDHIDGGDGKDAVYYHSLADWQPLTDRVWADLDAGTVYVGDPAGTPETDTLVSIESIFTGEGADSVMGSAADNDISTAGANDHAFGLAGDDRIYGGAGNDWLEGGIHDDVLHGDGGDDDLIGGPGVDTLYGGEGNDALSGGNGHDTLDGGPGADGMNGGEGGDTYYVDNPDDVIIDPRDWANVGDYDIVLASATCVLHNVAGGVGIVTLTGTDDIDAYGHDYGSRIFGQEGDNTLAGGGGSDELWGRNGNDQLIGGAGSDELWGGDDDDRLIGGLGQDDLWGGSGFDTFVFVAVSDSPANNPDRIIGNSFDNPGGGPGTPGDVIDLSAIDADATRPSDQPFTLAITTHPGLGQLTITSNAEGDTVLTGYVDGTPGADFRLIIRDGEVKASAYVTSDFVL
jgi:Ca2+-binding RTX toxin-like protein